MTEIVDMEVASAAFSLMKLKLEMCEAELAAARGKLEIAEKLNFDLEAIEGEDI
jgi:hypothetical protein